MISQTPARRFTVATPQRQVEGEGILRMLVLVAALVMPLGAMAYLKIQQTRMSYAMSTLRDACKAQEEYHRNLLLERSKYHRDETIQNFALQTGLAPRQGSHRVPRAFTKEDQRLAKLVPQGTPRGL